MDFTWYDWQKNGMWLLMGLLGLFSAWVRMKAGSFRLTSMRQDKLLKLLQKLKKPKDIESVSALALQMATKQAFGKSVPEKDLYFIMKREDPLRLIEKRVRAAHFVRLKDDASGFEDDRLFFFYWPSFKLLNHAAPLITGMLLPFFYVFCEVAWSEHWVSGAIATVESAFCIWGLLWLGGAAHAAKDVLSLKGHALRQVSSRKRNRSQAKPRAAQLTEGAQLPTVVASESAVPTAASKNGKFSAKDIEPPSKGTLVLVEEPAAVASNTSPKAVQGTLASSPSKGSFRPEISRTG